MPEPITIRETSVQRAWSEELLAVPVRTDEVIK
jgi:hypothetical protein